MKAADWLVGFGLLAAVVALPTSAGAWTYEQIDTAGTWNLIEIEVMANGTICICYQDSTTGSLFFAEKGDTWHRVTLGTANRRGRHLVAGPRGRPAVLMSNNPISYLVETDTGWTNTVLGWGGSTVFLAFDTSGSPSVLWTFSNGSGSCLSSAFRQDTAWVRDTMFWQSGGIYPLYLTGLASYVTDRQNRFNTLMTTGRQWSGDPFPKVDLQTGRTGQWTGRRIVDNTWCGGLALAPAQSGGVVVCYFAGYGFYTFYCDTAGIDSGVPSLLSVRVDINDHPQLVYRIGDLKYAYRTDQWYFNALPDVMDVAHLDLAVDALCCPLVAFISPPGIFLATGAEVGAVEKEPMSVPEHLTLPTIVRGVLELPTSGDGRGTRYSLFDNSGRRLLDLSPGANSVGRFASGVYFVRSTLPGHEYVRKVVIQN